MKIGYLGPRGSYSYEVACLLAEKAPKEAECIALPGFAAIIAGVEGGDLDHGIIPVENSTHGAVASAMDALLNLQKGTVCREVVLNIEHCLLSNNTDISQLKYVYSHDQALEQCRQFFLGQPHIELIHCSSTSQACELAQKDPACGAVAGKQAAQLYKLPVVAANIHDNIFNQTRFLIIGNQPVSPTGKDKTSIIFAFHDDSPGSLYKILKSFAGRSINLTRIESRPAKELMGKYIFYIDFCGHVQDKVSAGVLREIGRQVCWLKVLGSYPVDSGKKEEQAGGALC